MISVESFPAVLNSTRTTVQISQTARFIALPLTEIKKPARSSRGRLENLTVSSGYGFSSSYRLSETIFRIFARPLSQA